MEAKKTSKISSKKAFILSFPKNVDAEKVVSDGKEYGLNITKHYVWSVRCRPLHGTKAAKKTNGIKPAAPVKAPVDAHTLLSAVDGLHAALRAFEGLLP